MILSGSSFSIPQLKKVLFQRPRWFSGRRLNAFSRGGAEPLCQGVFQPQRRQAKERHMSQSSSKDRKDAASEPYCSQQVDRLLHRALSVPTPVCVGACCLFWIFLIFFLLFSFSYETAPESDANFNVFFMLLSHLLFPFIKFHLI